MFTKFHFQKSKIIYKSKNFSSFVEPKKFSFEIIYKSKKSNARAGIIHTPHGDVWTPSFVPVATTSTLKCIDIQTVRNTGIETGLIFVNTYHMVVHPGSEVVEAAGGLHKFMNYDRPLITDSGGFQVFSLLQQELKQGNDELKGKSKKNYSGSVLKVTDEGVKFRSYRNGDEIFLTPESSIQFQKVKILTKA